MNGSAWFSKRAVEAKGLRERFDLQRCLVLANCSWGPRTEGETHATKVLYL